MIGSSVQIRSLMVEKGIFVERTTAFGNFVTAGQIDVRANLLTRR
jgi:hypothetical protein